MRKQLRLKLNYSSELILGAILGIFLLCFSHYAHYFMVRLEVISPGGYQLSDLWRYGDYPHYYGAAWLFSHSSKVYGESLEFLQPKGFVLAKEIPSATNPPLLVLLLSFLAKLSPETGWVILQVISALCAILAIGLVIRNFAPQEPSQIKLVIFALALIGFWFVQHLLYSQIQSVLFLLSMMSWCALRKAKNILGGSLIGLVISLKLFLWPLALFLILTGRFAAMFSALIVIVSALMLTQSFDSLSYVDFFEHAVPIIRQCAQNSILNLSLFGALSRLYTALSLATSIERTELVTFIISAVSSFIFSITVTLFAHFKYSRGLLEEGTFFASVLVISILSSPVCWPHYLCFSIPLFLVIGLRKMMRQSLVIVLWLSAPWQTTYISASSKAQLNILSVVPTLIMLFVLFRALTDSVKQNKVERS